MKRTAIQVSYLVFLCVSIAVECGSCRYVLTADRSLDYAVFLKEKFSSLGNVLIW